MSNLDPNDVTDSPIVRAVEHAVKSALRWQKLKTRLLGIGLTVSLLLSVGLGYVAWQAHTTSETLKADSISSCEGSNMTRALDQQVWDSFVQLLVKGSANSQAVAEGKTFEKAVAKAYAPKDCAQTYSTSGSAANLGFGVPN